jgi:hypothetical protein
MRSFLGQVPLVLGPGSWGFPGLLPNQAPGFNMCPPGTFTAADGTCRPTTTREGIPKPQPPIPVFPVAAVPNFDGWF